MDLSQEELPLTAFFTRGTKGTRSRAVPHKKETPSEDLQSVARSSKRRKSSVQCSTASPSGSSVGRSKLRPTTLQLPTPATSTRKRTRNGCPRLPAKTQLSSTGVPLSPVEQNPPLPSEGLSQLESGPTPSKLPRSLREGEEDAVPESSCIPLPTPSTDRRRTAKSIIESHLGPRRLGHGEVDITTPPTLSRRVSELVDDIDDSRLPSGSSQASPDSRVSLAVLPHERLSSRSTPDLPCFPVDLDCPDPFHAREKGSNIAQKDSTFMPPKQYVIRSKTLDGQASDDCAIPMIPVPSSQSQYLLHLDATPKRKRCSRHIERVISSQTPEELELTLSTPPRPTSVAGLPVGVSPGKYMHGNAEILRLGYSERKSLHIYTLGSTPVGSPVNSPARPSRSFATKKALDELSSVSSSPSRRERLTSYPPPSCKTKIPRRSRHSSIENIPPAHIEDSLTESESESDILQMQMKARLSALEQAPRHSPVARDIRPLLRRGSVESKLPGTEDDSATEAESDTEILHCVAEISRKRPRAVSREDTLPPPVISPLVSPARSRIAAMPSIIGCTQFSTQESTGFSIPESCASRSSTMEQSQTPSGSLSSAVRDFFHMFPGDDSYPADFPESLRV